jgi:hypothetical protein
MYLMLLTDEFLAYLLLILIIFAGLLVAVVVRLPNVFASFEERLTRLTEEVRYDIPPARRAVIKRSIVTILRGGSEMGVAFFISPTVAITVAHNLLLASKAGLLRRVICVHPNDKEKRVFTFDVVAFDIALDFAVLRLQMNERPSAHHLTLRAANEAEGHNGVVFFVTCNILLAKEARGITHVNITIRRAHITKIHGHHLLYGAHAFDGDSAGAVVIGRRGEVIGLHMTLVNAARELLQRKEGAGEQLEAIELSVKSLIAGTALGCIGVRVESETARELIHAAMAP